MITSNSVPKRNEQLLSQQSSDTLILFNLDDGQYYALNNVGARVWELSDGTRSVSELVSVICQEFGAPREEVESDVVELLEELADERLVMESEGSS